MGRGFQAFFATKNSRAGSGEICIGMHMKNDERQWMSNYQPGLLECLRRRYVVSASRIRISWQFFYSFLDYFL